MHCAMRDVLAAERTIEMNLPDLIVGKDIAAARDHAYDAIRKIHFDGAFCRKDIAHRALHR